LTCFVFIDAQDWIRRGVTILVLSKGHQMF
jgi:hypothetical protein